MGKLTRTKVIINKTSLEQLSELNVHAEKVGCIVMIGVLPAGTDLGFGEIVEPMPHYMVLDNSMFKKGFEELNDAHVGFTKEDVLQKIIGLAKHGGVCDETKS